MTSLAVATLALCGSLVGGALVAMRGGFAPVGALVVCFLVLAGYLAYAWTESTDAPGAALGAVAAMALALFLLVGGLLGLVTKRTRELDDAGGRPDRESPRRSAAAARRSSRRERPRA